MNRGVSNAGLTISVLEGKRVIGKTADSPLAGIVRNVAPRVAASNVVKIVQGPMPVDLNSPLLKKLLSQARNRSLAEDITILPAMTSRESDGQNSAGNPIAENGARDLRSSENGQNSEVVQTEAAVPSREAEDQDQTGLRADRK